MPVIKTKHQAAEQVLVRMWKPWDSCGLLVGM